MSPDYPLIKYQMEYYSVKMKQFYSNFSGGGPGSPGYTVFYVFLQNCEIEEVKQVHCTKQLHNNIIILGPLFYPQTANS